MRFVIAFLLASLAAGASAQAEVYEPTKRSAYVQSELAFADSVTSALGRFALSFERAQRTLPDTSALAAVDGWEDVQKTRLALVSSAEQVEKWAFVLPLMRCEEDVRAISVSFRFEAADAWRRTLSFVGALERAVGAAEVPEVRNGIERLHGIAVSLDEDLRATFLAAR